MAQNKTGFRLEVLDWSITEVLKVDFGEDKEDEVAQNNNGCLVDNDVAVDLLSPVDCQKKTGDWGDDDEKSNLAGLVVDDEAVDVFGVVGSVVGLKVVVVDGVAGFSQGVAVENLQKKKLGMKCQVWKNT